ncbi:MAG: DUF58 domain-containing protein [Bradymonadia bacterium]
MARGAFPDPQLLALMSRLALWIRQGGGFPVHGRPLPGGAAAGLDFEGFTEYVPGMDLRHLDWPTYARTRGFYVRTFVDEGAGALAVLLDGSGSMQVGAPSKWQIARAIAAAVAYAGLSELHPLLIGVARGARLEALPFTGGLDFAPRVFEFLGGQQPSGQTDLTAALGQLPTGHVRGDALIISDFLDPRGPEAVIDALTRTGWRVDLCRVSAPGEFELPEGVAFFDPEGEGHVVVPDGQRRINAAGLVQAHRERLEQAARQRGLPLVDVSTDTPLPQILTQLFRALSS